MTMEPGRRTACALSRARFMAVASGVASKTRAADLAAASSTPADTASNWRPAESSSARRVADALARTSLGIGS